MDQLSKKKVIKKPTVVEGQGTGTSDEIKASVPEGSFVMPADSTARLGVGKKFGGSPRQVDVNLSNGEAVIPPDEAAAIGHSTLEHLKNQTHTPVEQPHVQMGESGEPELFFADGGFVGRYPSADDIRKARRGTNFPSTRHAQEFVGRQQQAGGPPQARMGQTYEGQARNVNPPPSTRHAQEFIGRQQQAGGAPQARMGQTYEGQARNVNPPPSTRHAQEFIGRQQQAGGAPQTRTGQTYNGQARTVSPQAPTGGSGGSGGAALGASGSGGVGAPPVSGSGGAGLGAKAWNTAKNFGKGMTHFATAGGLLTNAYTPSEQYRERFGIGEQSAEDLGTAKGFAKDFGVRALGYASDVGNILTGGTAGRFYQDNINREARMAKLAAQPQPKVEPQDKPQDKPQPKARSLAETAGMTQPPQVQAQTQPQVQAQVQSNDPYAIVQNGNSFSYANPQAASQARAAGTPEGQSPNIIGGMRGAGDPRGVANLFANTQEMGPTEQQIQNAIAQREMNIGMQGRAGIPREIERPTLSDEEKGKRDALARQINSAIDPKYGPTAKQADMLLQLSSDNPNALDVYKTDANNAAALQREAMGQAGQNYRTELGEQGATGRAAMQEQGANYRSDSNLQHSYWRDGNNFALDNRRVSLDEMKEGPGIRTAQRIESLRDKYANATTDEEKQALLGLMNLYGGKEANQAANGKDRFITVARPADPVNGTAGGQALYDTVTGEWLDAPGAASLEEGTAKQFVKGRTYTDPQSGKSAYLDENRNWVEYRGN